MGPKLVVRTHVLASIATGVVLENIQREEMIELFSQLYGKTLSMDEISTSSVQDAVSKEIYNQFPRLPTKAEAEKGWEAALTKVVSIYGESVEVARGMHAN